MYAIYLHFGEDETKCILFSKDTSLTKLKITCNNNKIKQYRMVEYLGCCLDANLSGESMAAKSRRKINPYIDKMSFRKCFRFCLKLNSRQHIGAKEFRETNCLPAK